MATDLFRSEALGVEASLAPDDVLAMIVHVANTTNVEMGVTLHVNGQVISGKLISGATFWSESAERLRASGEGSADLLEAMASCMEQVADGYDDAYADPDTDLEEPSLAAFVHLREAHTLTPQGPTPTAGALWRGRLASVDGVTFGELSGIS